MSVFIQGINVNILKYRELINAFKKKVKPMVSTSRRRQFIKFSLLEEVTDEDKCLLCLL